MPYDLDVGVKRNSSRRHSIRAAPLRRAAMLFAVLALVSLMPSGASADPYPSKLIRLIVPFTPGGGSDIVARLIAQKLGARLGQSVIVDNRPGAGGNIGSDAVAHSAPDGHTLILGNTATHAVNASLYKKLSFDVVADFQPVSFIGSGPHVLVVNNAVAAKSVAEFVQMAKHAPGRFNYASFGSGSTSHLAGEIFKAAAGVDIVHVPYKGTAPAITDVISGQVQAMFVPIAPAVPHIKGGSFRAIAVTSAKRNSVLPEIPTMIELGYADFEASLWYGVFAPAATPKDIVDKLGNELSLIVRTPELKEALVQQGIDAVGDGPEAFSAYRRAEVAKWAKAVKDAGVTLD